MIPKPDILVCDSDIQTSTNNYDVINWSSYSNSESVGIYSIPQFIEDNADYLKDKYLKLIYDFGESKIDGKRLIDHLIFRKDFSFWWMTLFVEKSNYGKSPNINDIIKLIALHEWLKDKKYKRIKLATSNHDLAMALSLLAKEMLIDFEWKKEKNQSQVGKFRKVFHLLPFVFQSPIWLLYYIFSNWSLKGTGVLEWKKTTADSTFISYLFNLAPEAQKNGQYKSLYWTSLTDLMEENNFSSNWLHLYTESSSIPSAKNARDLIKSFNNQNNKQVHVTLSSFLSLSLIFSALKDWLKIVKFYNLVHQQIKMNSSYLWPLFKKDCKNSMIGIPAISNLLYFNLFETAMNLLPKQRRGCYLQENQGWEFGFISAWYEAGHNKNLIGFPTAAIVYWDLRNFFDSRSYLRKNQGDLPLPTYVGVNGESSKQTYVNGGYPNDNLIELESLRYLYLNKYTNSVPKRKGKELKEIKVLVAGDYLKENTHKQLNLLSLIMTDIDKSIDFIIKPHPACPIDMDDFPNLRGELSSQSIEELIKITDIMYSSLITSAAIDAYSAGVPLITFLDGETLNMSPLRGAEGVYFVSNSRELLNAICTINDVSLTEKTNYFFLNPNLPRWKKWLFDNSNEEVVSI